MIYFTLALLVALLVALRVVSHYLHRVLLVAVTLTLAGCAHVRPVPCAAMSVLETDAVMRDNGRLCR